MFVFRPQIQAQPCGCLHVARILKIEVRVSARCPHASVCVQTQKCGRTHLPRVLGTMWKLFVLTRYPYWLWTFMPLPVHVVGLATIAACAHPTPPTELQALSQSDIAQAPGHLPFRLPHGAHAMARKRQASSPPRMHLSSNSLPRLHCEMLGQTLQQLPAKRMPGPLA